MSSRTAVDLEILKVLYAVQFAGFLRGHTPEEWTYRWTSGDLAELRKGDGAIVPPIPPIEDDGHAFDDVPDYILSAILSTRGVREHEFKNAIRLLETRGDVHYTRDVNWYGRWCTEDEHVIEVSWGNQPFPPTRPPYNAIVTLDGESFQQMGLFHHPVGRCYALTTEGIKRVEMALGKKPETGAAQSPARHSPEQLPLVGGGRVAEPTTATQEEVSLPRRAQKAGGEYRQAAEALGVSDPVDRQAYDQLAAAMEKSGEQADLPRFDTWQRNLREYRRLTGQQKNKPRAGREGSSGKLVRADQIEPEHLPTRIRPKRVDQ